MTSIASPTIPIALTIAGSDSGGGAGMQADLRTFAVHRVHGTCAVTCITAQNTLGVTRVDALPPEAVVAQIDAVADDIGFDAVKTGMLLDRAIVAAVAEKARNAGWSKLVVDPVMVSRTGAQLIDDDAVAALKNHLLPLGAIATPNRYEAQILSGLAIETLDDMKAAAEKIHHHSRHAVLVKGGAMSGNCHGVDVWFNGDRLEVLQTTVVNTRHTHGTGCTLSAAITANLAWGNDPLSAVKAAKQYVTEALHRGLNIGKGQGPVGQGDFRV